MSMSGEEKDEPVEAKTDDEDVFREDDPTAEKTDGGSDEDKPREAAVARRSMRTFRGLTSRCIIPHECR
jgi:hypothetical protein